MIFHLPSGVRARKENFGLLFYDARDAKLTFVRSGSLFRLERAGSGSSLLKISDPGADPAKAQRILARLVKKGLIVDERADL